MPIADVTPIQAYVGNGVSTTFAMPFKIFAVEDLVFQVAGITLLYGSDYTLSVGAIGADSFDVIATVPPANLATVLGYRAIPYNRIQDYQEAGDFLANTIDNDIDRTVAQIQQLRRDQTNALHFPVGDTQVSELPAAAARSSLFVAFDSNGGVIAVAGPLSGPPVTPYAATLLDDPDKATALLTLGLKNAVNKGDILVATGAGVYENKTRGADGYVMLPDSFQSDAMVWVPAPISSLCRNPHFQIDQRGGGGAAISRADDTYCLDGWYVLTQTAAITAGQQTDQEAGMPFSIRLTQTNAAAQRFGLAQIIEGKDCKKLRGEAVYFGPRIRSSDSRNIRIAILEWTGTEDAVLSDVVNDWTNGAYGSGQFFNAANLSGYSVSAGAFTAATWGDVSGGISAVIGASTTNIIVMVWTEATAPQNMTLDLGMMRLVRGGFIAPPTRIEIPNWSDEQRRMMRYYWKTFNYSVVPANNTGTAGALGYRCIQAGVNAGGMLVRFPVPMRGNPGVTSYNPGNAANSNWRNAAADSGAFGAPANFGIDSFFAPNAQAAGDAVGNLVSVHIKVEDEL